MDPSHPRYTMEQEGDFFYARDEVTKDRLPYKSHDRSEIERMIERLNGNYEDYVKSTKKRASLQ